MSLYKGILSSLRNQLEPRKKNPEYLQWRAEHRVSKYTQDSEGHHILSKKIIDLLIADIPIAFHKEITNQRTATELEQIEMLVSSLEELFDFVEFLQDELSSTSN